MKFWLQNRRSQKELIEVLRKSQRIKMREDDGKKEGRAQKTVD